MPKGHLNTEGRLKQNVSRLKTNNARLRTENSQLKADNQELRETLETLKIQVAELQTMVFGKKRPPTGHHVPDLAKPETKPRDKSSFRRPIPPAHAITSTEPVSLSETCSCGGKFKNVTVHERYEEDIPLPELTKDYQAHLVTKYVVERGVCVSCGKASSGMDLGGQTVSLGSNIRLLICHLVSVVGLSYAQIIQLCQSLYSLHVTDGEIANILGKQHRNWLPQYEQLKADVRASPVRHYDETPWKIVEADNSGYAWAMSAADSPVTVFHLATSRGGRHAVKLHGNSSGIYITDDYSPYRNLSGQQQLCWAHLYRCIRDLRYNDNLPEEHLPYVKQWYEDFASIYQDLQTRLGEPYQLVRRQNQSKVLWQRIQKLASQQPPKSNEPNKLTRLKAQLLRAGKDRLFTCLIANTPCDNNRAERDLRPLVLKRKRSFGSKTKKGASALATILSICTTTHKATPDTYFKALAAI